jgi:hypothetical protein
MPAACKGLSRSDAFRRQPEVHEKSCVTSVINFYNMITSGHAYLHINRLLLFCGLWFMSSALLSQYHVRGQIIDSETGKGVHGASVFIANTTAGTTTDLDGNYQLKFPGKGIYKLAVSHVGYLPIFYDTETIQPVIHLNIVLEMREREIEEVTVVAKKQYRNQDVALFWKTILGCEPSEKIIYATNSEAVYFYYNPDAKILKATSRVPLSITNNETGYDILYVLESFIHDYNTNVTSWNGRYLFTELTAENFEQKTKWGKNREKVYSVSVTGFIRSLYNNSLMENGFLLSYWREPVMDANKPVRELSLPDVNNFLSIDTSGNKMFNLPSDSSVILICFGKHITEKDLGRLRLAQNGKLKWAALGLYRNMLNIPDGALNMEANGTFKNPLRLSPAFSSKPLTGLNMLLPIEYHPEQM